MFYVTEVFIHPVHNLTFCLTDIIFSADFASYGIYQIIALTACRQLAWLRIWPTFLINGQYLHVLGHLHLGLGVEVSGVPTFALGALLYRNFRFHFNNDLVAGLRPKYCQWFLTISALCGSLGLWGVVHTTVGSSWSGSLWDWLSSFDGRTVLSFLRTFKSSE